MVSYNQFGAFGAHLFIYTNYTFASFNCRVIYYGDYSDIKRQLKEAKV